MKKVSLEMGNSVGGFRWEEWRRHLKRPVQVTLPLGVLLLIGGLQIVLLLLALD